MAGGEGHCPFLGLGSFGTAWCALFFAGLAVDEGEVSIFGTRFLVQISISLLCGVRAAGEAGDFGRGRTPLAMACERDCMALPECEGRVERDGGGQAGIRR